MASFPCDHARRLEAGEGEGLDEFLQRHAVLQADRNRDGEVVHQRAEGRAFLVHVDEDLGEAAVLVFAGAQIDLVAADRRLLRIALAAIRQAAALGALDHALDDPLGHGNRLHGRGLGHDLLGLLLILDELRGERLDELGAVAIEGIGLQPEAPGQHIGLLAILDRGRVRHVDGLGDGARDEGLGGRHHADMALGGEEALADAAAGIGAVEDRQDASGSRSGAPSSVIAPQQ